MTWPSLEIMAIRTGGVAVEMYRQANIRCILETGLLWLIGELEQGISRGKVDA